MSGDIDKSSISFSQAHGLEPLPTQLEPRQLDDTTRTNLWNALFGILTRSKYLPRGARRYVLRDPWLIILYNIHTDLITRPADEFDNDYESSKDFLKNFILKGEWNYVLDLVQFILRSQDCPKDLEYAMMDAFAKSFCPYTIVDDGVPTIVQIGTPEEEKAIRDAFEALLKSNLDGARVHLRNASEALTSGHFAECVRESIHSVESVAKMLDGDASKTLGPAITSLERRGIDMHGAFKNGIESLYGYTSDEDGIRHALLDEEAKVDQEDALFMIGACASFVTYLVGKGRSSGLLTN